MTQPCDPANPPRIIAIETSSRQGSVAVGVGATLLGERCFPTQSDHARDLLPAIDSLCLEQGWKPGDLNECYVSIGPGSFTGLRVAVTLARAWAFGLGLRIVSVSTLAVIAENCADLPTPPRRPAVILDAKRRQVFGSVFEWTPAGYQPLMNPTLMDPIKLLTGELRPDAVIGEGIGFHREAVNASGVPPVDAGLWFPRASGVYRLGQVLSAAGCYSEARLLVPHYLRRPEAEELWEARCARSNRPHL